MKIMDFMHKYHTAGHIFASLGQFYSKPLHQHTEACEILLVISGSGLFTVNQKSYRVGPGSVVMYNAGDWHEERVDPRSPFQALYLSCSGQLVEGLPDSFIRDTHMAPVQFFREFSDLQSLLEKIIQRKHDPRMLQQLLALFFCTLDRALAPPDLPNKSDVPQLMRAAMHYIEEHHSRELTLTELADELGMNKYALARQFKEVTGISPIQYAIQCRIKTAQHLLSETAYAVPEIASQTGYKSATHFQQAFKKAVGKTPGVYRRELAALK